MDRRCLIILVREIRADGQLSRVGRTESRWQRKEMVFGKSISLDQEEFRNAAMAATSMPVLASSESDFIDKLRARDSAAFDTLVERYTGDIYALLHRLTESADEAADLTQETFLSALRSVNKFRGDSGIKTWLFRIAINESRNRFRWWKRRKRDQTISLDAFIGSTDMIVSDSIADGGASPEENALRSEREAVLTAALLDLPIVFREAVILCDVEGLSYEETAIALDVGIGTVKSRISRGREELRQRLKGF